MQLEKTYNPSAIEDKLYQKWLDHKYFHAEVDRSKKPFTIVIPPPNITGQLRSEEVGDMASKTSAIPEVRTKLLELQRTMAREHDVVMDGRDIGTNILPDADVKIYLTASVETRAKRRFDELQAKGQECDLTKIQEDIRARDHRDMTRETAPLKQADDAVLVDSSDMNIEEVTDAILAICADKQKETV